MAEQDNKISNFIVNFLEEIKREREKNKKKKITIIKGEETEIIVFPKVIYLLLVS